MGASRKLHIQRIKLLSSILLPDRPVPDAMSDDGETPLGSSKINVPSVVKIFEVPPVVPAPPAPVSTSSTLSFNFQTVLRYVPPPQLILV